MVYLPTGTVFLSFLLFYQDHKVIGIITLSDILKQNIKEAITELHSAGIHRTVLLTGDNKNAAEYIATKSGITEINASLLPEDKVRIISEIENEGDYICMIGDGINDAAALKTAYVKRLSNATIYNIKVNISISMVINVLAIILSLLGVLNPTTGALVHNAGSVLVVMNAARLYDRSTSVDYPKYVNKKV
ncbi:HAD-IC family P-type ATPase [Clostridium sp. BJN0013]|uniref:HAD-IC family P-type ATPase n=1 Tax=Clostridium sp. BJN0013 TaxID=3236840 RepID=UPI0034C6D5F2